MLKLSKRLMKAGSDRLKGFLQRILVHALAILIGVSIASTLAATPLHDSRTAVLFLSYMGIICLFPRGYQRRMDWLVPSGFGLLFAVLFCVFGGPWQLSVFWSGVQSYVLTILCKKFDLGWSWATLPWLILGAISFSSGGIPSGALVLPLWLFVPVTIAGYAIFYYGVRFLLTPQRKKMLLALTKDLNAILAKNCLPAPFEEPVKRLASQTQLLGKYVPVLDDRHLSGITAVTLLTNKLKNLTSGEGTIPWNYESEHLATAIEMINEDLAEHLQYLDITNAVEEIPLTKEELRIREFQDLAKNLARKKNDLPQSLHPHIDGLRIATQSILDEMRSDPRDMAAGERFLSRYLPAAHTVLDNYIRLSKSSADNQEVATVLLRCEDFIKRLEQRFVKEHGDLMRNDTIDLNAELATLDTLLKIDRH